MYKEEFGKSFQYDSKRNLLSSKYLVSLKDNAAYDAFNNLTEYRQAGRADTVKTRLEYGSTDAEKKKHLLKKKLKLLRASPKHRRSTRLPIKQNIFRWVLTDTSPIIYNVSRVAETFQQHGGN